MYLAPTAPPGPAFDISGDIGQIDTADMSVAPLDVTGINSFNAERLSGVLDAKLGYTGFYDNAPGGGFAVQRPLIGKEAQAVWSLGAAEGVPGFAIVGLVTAFNLARGANGSLTLKAQLDSDVGAADWGFVGANATDAAPANHPGFQSVYLGRAVAITAISVASPGVVTAASHGLQTGDSVVIAGSNSTPTLDGQRTVTVIDANTFNVGVTTTAPGSAGTVTQTSTRYGGRLYVLVRSIGTGQVVVKLQHAADGVTFTDIAGMTTGPLDATTARAVITSTPGQLWLGTLRVATTGTFTNASVIALCHRGTGPRS